MDTLGTWIAAIGTLAIMSFAWGENPLYRAFEHIFVGVAAGHGFTLAWANIQSSVITPVKDGTYIPLIFVFLGLLLYSRFFKGYSWVSRYPMSVLVGIGTGLTLRGTIGSQLVEQIQATMLPLNSFDNIVMVVGTITTLMFFFFTAKKQYKLLSGSAQIGRYVMMIAFGATFGNTILGRMSMMIGRVQFLLGDWLGLI